MTSALRTIKNTVDLIGKMIYLAKKVFLML